MGYEPSAGRDDFTFKCIPYSGLRQRLISHEYSVLPSDYVSKWSDGFGNRYLYGSVFGAHDSLTLQVSGIVLIDAMKHENDSVDLLPLFRMQSDMTRPGVFVSALYSEISRFAGCAETFVTESLERLHSRFVYRKGTTQVSTTAEEALTLGCGVCQDYSHIMLSLLRCAGIPCRYVAGLVPGEGETHAWIEYYSKGFWIGVDPTAKTLVDDGHIVFAYGQDATDCLINRGVVHLNGRQTMKVCASVKEIP